MGNFFTTSSLTALLTLVVLELVLNIDNLVFLSILTGKLPAPQRPQARKAGLILALFLRYFLLAIFSWLVTLVKPVFFLFGHGFSVSDIILLCGGFFLLVKALAEIHDQLEPEPDEEHETGAAGFWVVVAQVVILDAVFSLDSIITAVGLVRQLPLMMAATTISMFVMLLASGPLARFVNSRPTVMVLSLTFLVLIGLSLLAEAVGRPIPEGYIYAAIGFAIVIEALNQVAASRRMRYEAGMSFRRRTAEAVLSLLGSRRSVAAGAGSTAEDEALDAESYYDSEEVYMVNRVLTLSERPAKSIMTPRSQALFINLEDSADEQLRLLAGSHHSVLPVCRENSLDTVVGQAYSAELMNDLATLGRIQAESIRPAVMVPESMRVTKLLETVRTNPVRMLFVTDEYGSVEGIITYMDLFEAIAGHVLEEGEKPEMALQPDGSWLLDGGMDVHSLEQELDITGIASATHDYTSVGGFILAQLGHLPELGDFVDSAGYRFTVKSLSGKRIAEVSMVKNEKTSDELTGEKL